MGLLQITKKHLRNLQEVHGRHVKASEDRARRQLEKAKTKTEREKIRLQLQREKLKADKELYEARIATKRAKVAVEKARKEAGDLGIGERLAQTGRGLSKALWGTPPKRRKRKSTKRK